MGWFGGKSEKVVVELFRFDLIDRATGMHQGRVNIQNTEAAKAAILKQYPHCELVKAETRLTSRTRR